MERKSGILAQTDLEEEEEVTGEWSEDGNPRDVKEDAAADGNSATKSTKELEMTDFTKDSAGKGAFRKPRVEEVKVLADKAAEPEIDIKLRVDDDDDENDDDNDASLPLLHVTGEAGSLETLHEIEEEPSTTASKEKLPMLDGQIGKAETGARKLIPSIRVSEGNGGIVEEEEEEEEEEDPDYDDVPSGDEEVGSEGGTGGMLWMFWAPHRAYIQPTLIN